MVILKWPEVGHLEFFQNSEKSCIISLHGIITYKSMNKLGFTALAGRRDTHCAKKWQFLAYFFAKSRPF